MKNRLLVTALLALTGAGACDGTTLEIAEVGAPSVNCVFDADCTVSVTDKVDSLVLNGMIGSGFLQSRTLPVGEPGTVGAGLYAYEYRVDLRNNVGALNIACAVSLDIDFGAVAALDYDGDGNPEHVYVVTSGGLGSVPLASAVQTGDQITFSFSPGVCAGASPGNGESSFFFGLASSTPPGDATAIVRDNLAVDYPRGARAPALSP